MWRRGGQALVGEDPAIVEAYAYEVYGKPTIKTGDGGDGDWFDGDETTATASSLGNPYLFTARRWDDDISLQFNRARWYDPDPGRWLSRDATGYIDGTNLYEYVRTCPARFADPSGLWYLGAHEAMTRSALLPDFCPDQIGGAIGGNLDQDIFYGGWNCLYDPLYHAVEGELVYPPGEGQPYWVTKGPAPSILWMPLYNQWLVDAGKKWCEAECCDDPELDEAMVILGKALHLIQDTVPHKQGRLGHAHEDHEDWSYYDGRWHNDRSDYNAALRKSRQTVNRFLWLIKSCPISDPRECCNQGGGVSGGPH